MVNESLPRHPDNIEEACIGEFVTHDWRPRFGGLDHVPGNATYPQRPSPEMSNMLILLPLSERSRHHQTCYRLVAISFVGQQVVRAGDHYWIYERTFVRFLSRSEPTIFRRSLFVSDNV
jgi:hypothetical protein